MSTVAALIQQGIVLHQQGQLPQAKALYERALAQQPGLFDALHLLGVIASQSGKPAQALDLIGQALAINPRHAQAHNNFGNALTELHRLPEALASYDRAIELKPGWGDAHFNRGNVLQRLGRHAEAIADYDQALLAIPDHAQAHRNRGRVLHRLGRLEDALLSYAHAIRLSPDWADAHYSHGNALKDLKRLELALVSYNQVIALNPKHVYALNNRAGVLLDLERPAEALLDHDRAITLQPDSANIHYNRSTTLKDLHRLEDALAGYDQAIALSPDYADAHWNKALILLLLGDYRRGWPLCEWRWQTESLRMFKRHFSQPLWLGQEYLHGKTILLHAEQGLGDSIQFCRYVPWVSARGARVLLQVPSALINLFQTCAGVDVLLDAGQVPPAFDFHCPLMSLPLAFKTRLDTIPTPAGYLSSHASKRQKWQERLGEKTKPRIGLVWRGNTAFVKNHLRSLALAEFLQHLPSNCDYISLQKETQPDDLPALTQGQAQGRLQHLGPALLDLADTAALCDLMDVVLTVDTSVAHLAAALGRPTWILLAPTLDWRWLLDREDSPWYASVRLYRRAKDQDWTPVLQHVAADLRRLG